MAKSPQVVVVGAGIIGCAVAYELARRGARVRVLDRRSAAQGATQASAGVLAPWLHAHAGRPLVDLGARSLSLFDEFVARVVEDSGSPVQYVRSGTLEVALSEAALEGLRATAAACRAAGGKCEVLDGAGVRRLEKQLSERIIGGLLVRDHGFIGAMELVAALQRAAGAYGVRFISSTAAARVRRRRGGLSVDLAGDSLACDRVVLAAGSWSGQVEVDGAPATPVRPVRGQILHLGWSAPRLSRVIWSAECYLVPWSDGSVLAGATVEDAGFDERATVDGVQQLLAMTRDIVPEAGAAWFRAVRVGLRPATPDELPVVGRSASLPGLVYATGHYRNGILLAPLTAALVAGLVLEERDDPALDVMAPSRFGAC